MTVQYQTRKQELPMKRGFTRTRCMPSQINISTKEITTFCQRHHIRELALFGSVLRDDFGPESDVDVLVEFEADAGVGYQRFFYLQDELTALLGREVDLFTPNSLKPFAKETALQSKTVIYEA